MTQYFVYILKCKDNSLYTGYTTDPKRRLKEHNLGKGAKYTRSRKPVKMVYLEKLNTLNEALKREYKIKTLNRNEKIFLIEKFREEKNV